MAVGSKNKLLSRAARERINNYLTFLAINLHSFHQDNALFFSAKEFAYYRKILEGENQLVNLLIDYDVHILEKTLIKKTLNLLHHDMRLSINIIQGYAELILETVLEKNISPVGNHFSFIIHCAQEILKNIDVLQ